MHALDEGETLAATARADLDHDIAKLAMPARLFLVPSAHRDGVADRFPIGDGRLRRLDGHAETVGEALGGHAQVHLALPEKLQFRHLSVLNIRERAILFAELGQRAGEPDLVLSVLDANGDPLSCGRSGEHDRGRRRGSPVSDAVASGEVFEPRESDGVALLGPRQLRRHGAHEPRQSADALLDAARIDDGRPVREGAAQHARQRQLAAVRGVDRAHHLRESWTLVLDAEPLARVGDARRFVPQRFQEPGDAMAGGGRTQEHRHDPPVPQFARQIVEDEVLRRVDVADQLLHQRVVIIGELLEHEIARLFFLGQHARRHLDDAGRRGLAIDEGALEREIDKSGGDAILPHRKLAQQQRRARGRLEHLERLAQVPVRLIDLVEEQDARRPEILQLTKNDLKRRDLARIGLAYDDCGVADGQGVAHVMNEFDRAGESKKVSRSPR